MEVYVKIFNDSLIKIFDTLMDKKKQVILTTASDFQQEAEAVFFLGDKKIKTIVFKNLPPARARVLDLPIIVELVAGNSLHLSYTGENKKTEEYLIDLAAEKSRGKALKPVLMVTGAFLVFGIITCLLVFFMPKLFKNTEASYNTVIESSSVAANAESSQSFESSSSSAYSETPSSSASSSESSRTVKPAFTKASLDAVIRDNTPLYFVIDKDEFLPGETGKLDNIIDYLKNFKKAELTLNGHTEKIGLPQNEMELSIKRAEAVKNYIRSKIPDKNIIMNTKGFGSTMPAVKDAAPDQQYLNRRVEIEVLGAE